MLELKEIHKTYISANGQTTEAVEDLSMTIARNEFVCLVGRSGCGKTTTLRMIAGLERATRGQIRLNGTPIDGPSAQRCVVFQRYTLFPWRSILDNVTFGLETQRIPKVKREEVARHYLSVVGLADYADAFPSEMSGGMQQRVAVARALAVNPEVLLMDEPFGALDAQTRTTLQNELTRIWETERKTIVFVTHDIPEAVQLSDRIVVMQGPPGRIQAMIDCNLPRPRDKGSASFIKQCEFVRTLLEGIN